ncbi:hypothetical protein [Streptomyces sp. ISL-11]|uniref:hypothetical protein n=1 Tax=Streptomyces sp. ISL-11 TaxID=2819174 RepID=UPI001BEA3F82|nr:hypothetical protein [Streptomyces sp. ISL-11]MBT2386370.1 hypothetical protein [Streptomyces sp. ISL-11]
MAAGRIEDDDEGADARAGMDPQVLRAASVADIPRVTAGEAEEAEESEGVVRHRPGFLVASEDRSSAPGGGPRLQPSEN